MTSTIPSRSTVGHMTINHGIWVRFPGRELQKRKVRIPPGVLLGHSAIGRRLVSGSSSDFMFRKGFLLEVMKDASNRCKGNWRADQ